MKNIFRGLAFYAFVLCMMLVLSTDAFAFGKRGKGIFGWRGSNSCTSCSGGQCATGSCATGCENGQCAPAQFQSAPQTFTATNGKTYKQVCENGRCSFVELETGPQTLGTSPSTFPLKPVDTVILHKDGKAWKDDSGNVWKK